MTVRVLWSWLERILLVVAIACLGYFGLMWADLQFEQRRENRELDRILHSREAAAPELRTSTNEVEGVRRAADAPHTGVLGRLEIPRLGVSATVREGDDARTLRQAVGHIPGTALPGASGNAGLAAHRDTFFQRLKDIRTRDAITFTSPDGIHHYIVEDILIVEPTNVSVLNDSESATLTLVTCYPFNYIGSAPKRFVVRAVAGSGDRRPRTLARAAVGQDVVGPVDAVATAGVIEIPQTALQDARETVDDARPVTKAKPRAKALRARSTPKKAPVAEPAKGNAISRFFKAAARGLGFGLHESPASTRSESRAPRTPRR